ncbi:MAG: ABC transporter permease [Candidatus Wallbacteria bacterium]|nr:ABC transporter permease [Candidatus Wallbacteria bacterium]
MNWEIRQGLPKATSAALGAASVALALLLWLSVTWSADVEQRWVSPLVLPSPGDVVHSFGPLHWTQGLTRGVVYSLARVTAGFLLAAAVAIPLGVAMGAFTQVRAFVGPLSVIGGYVPIAALVPLTISWFGLGESQKVAFLFIASFFMLLPMVVKSIADVDEVYLQTGYTLGASRWQTIRHVLVPVAAGDIYDHLRTLYGVGWGYIILAELVAAEHGLGHIIQVSQRRGRIEEVFAILLVILAIAIAIDQLFRAVGELLFPYRHR